jgi:hypothetical protein
MTISLQSESFESCIPDLKTIIGTHWDEVAGDKDVIPLDPDWEQYVVLENMNKLHMFTVRDDGKLIGYYISFIMNHIHYKQTKHSIMDIYFIHPEYRLKRVSDAEGNRRPLVRAFFEELGLSLKSIGVKKIYAGFKISHNHEKLFKKLGYRHTEDVYTKLL